MINRLKIISAIILAFNLTASANADSLIINGLAWHAEKHDLGPHDKNYNERNPGLGYEFNLTPNTAFNIGYYKNSFYKHSNYMLFSYQPFHYDGWKFGTAYGTISGYNNRSINPVIIPEITYETKHVGFNLFALPVPPVSRASVFGLQFKIKLP